MLPTGAAYQLRCASTEGGVIGVTMPGRSCHISRAQQTDNFHHTSAEIPSDWEYFRLSRQLGVKMVPHGNNTFELVIVVSTTNLNNQLPQVLMCRLDQSNEYSHPSVINTHVDGIDAWSTSDLLVEHPTKPGYWKIFGRSDDQIMHSTGEKVSVIWTRKPSQTHYCFCTRQIRGL